MVIPGICLEREACQVIQGKCDGEHQWLIMQQAQLQDFQKSFKKEIQSS